MIGVSLGLNFLSGGGAAVSGGGISVPDDPADPGGGDPGGGDPGTGDPGNGSDPTLAVLPVAATARWHPDLSTVTLDGDRVATAEDLASLAGLSAAPGQGPKAMTDGLGRAFWRFDGDAFLTVADTLALSSRDMSVFMVGRFHRVGVNCDVFSLGSVEAGSAINTNGAALRSTRTDQGMPLLQSFSRPSVNAYTEPEMMVTGSQMQVAGFVGRAGADGGSYGSTMRRSVRQGRSTLSTSRVLRLADLPIAPARAGIGGLSTSTSLSSTTPASSMRKEMASLQR